MTAARPFHSSPADSGRAMHDLVRRLFPICRSLTGDGVRQTLRIIGEQLPLTVHEVPSGSTAFDWVVPREWNLRDAWIARTSGERIVDFQANNLHVVGYSAPVRARIRLADLQPHLHSLPAQPNLIPYRTSYYNETWGFCLPDRLRATLNDEEYEVCIDSTLADGSLSYGEIVLPGDSDDEVLFYTHTCHPSLANDNLSGIAVSAFLARSLAAMPRRFTYRFVFAPGTLGSLVWLSRNEERWPRIRFGLVLVSLGDGGPLRYKQTRLGNAGIDRIAAHVLRGTGEPFAIEPFSPYGYDERQFGSPGINLPVGRLSRSANGAYPEYHTSADNLELVQPDALERALAACLTIVETVENDRRFRNTSPRGEPQLGRRGLYRTAGGDTLPDRELALLWILNLSDGAHSLLDIAERSGIAFTSIAAAARELAGAGLLEPLP